MIDFVLVGQRIAEHRRRLGLSQEELAARLYVTRQAVSKWENGSSVPSIDMLSELSRLYGVSFEELLGLFEKLPGALDEEDIFTGHDRSYIISKIISGDIRVKLHNVMWQMSPAERMYILKFVKEGSLKVNKRLLIKVLNQHEKRYLES